MSLSVCVIVAVMAIDVAQAGAQPARSPGFALKTNLLFDAALAPNAEAELALGKRARWSLMAEAWFPWYTWHHNTRSYEVLVLGGEARLWLGNRRCHSPLTGHFLGAYGAWGKYDLEWNSVGDQGEVQSCGLSYGYSWPVARRLNIEASLAAGVVWGRRHHYHGEFNDEHLIWKYDATLRYLGPTKAKLSLVWMLGRTKGGRHD